jgi:molecular chaperone DnaK (HSP70)
MAGQLNTNPYLKTYDELQRSIKRMETYLNINDHLLSHNEKAALESMINQMNKALDKIPDEFRKTKHHYSKKD